MKIASVPKLKLYSFLFSMPIIDIAVNQILYRERLWKEWQIWAFSFPLIFIFGYVSWYTRITASAKTERKYPELNQTWKRIRIKILICCISMITAVGSILSVYSMLNILDYEFRTADIWQGALLAFCVNLIFETLYDAEYAVNKYREAEEEKEMLRQQSFSSEFDTLKNQINPHFLFNCFNTVSSLIREDKETANIFINELSKVYRYLLKNNEEGLSTVEAEIRFVHSYYKLLQTRYGEAFRLEIHTDPAGNNMLLPSLSLQLLIENAVKHNIVARSTPLVIGIFTRHQPSCLIVRNNLQLRNSNVSSNKIGLRNIQMKYDLLGMKGFVAARDEQWFQVVLPLIDPSKDFE